MFLLKENTCALDSVLFDVLKAACHSGYLAICQAQSASEDSQSLICQQGEVFALVNTLPAGLRFLQDRLEEKREKKRTTLMGGGNQLVHWDCYAQPSFDFSNGKVMEL